MKQSACDTQDFIAYKNGFLIKVKKTDNRRTKKISTENGLLLIL